MEIINYKRYEGVKSLFSLHGIELSEKDIALYANVFEIISQFVNGKLTDEEIMTAYDFLSDVVMNRRPDIAIDVPLEDRIRVQVKLMEQMAETKGKLDPEEKMALAYCVCRSECTRVFDEKTNKICNGMVCFDSFERIYQELEYEKKQFPSRFKMEEKRGIFDRSYGYSKENPIQVTSIGASYFYLSQLRYEGKPVIQNRLGSFRNSKGDLIDGYDIFIEKRGIIKKKTIKIATLYINAYCKEMPKVAPEGFTLV